MASIKALHIEIGARVSGFTRKMRKIRRSVQRMSRRIKKMASAFTAAGRKAAFGIGLIGTGMVLAGKRFATFEANLLRVKALTGAAEKDFNALKATAERMGITTAFTASEAAEAMVKLAQQGRTTTQTMKMLPHVLDLAVVGSLDLAEAARLAGVTLNQFGMGTHEVQRAVDVLAKGASVSATTVQELGEAMTYAGPLSKNLGFSLEETTAVLAAFANVGVVSGRAGRAFAAVLAELGSEIRAKGLINALEDLAKSGKTADQLMTELNRIAGRSVGSLREVTGEIESIQQRLAKSTGTAKNFAETVLSRLQGAFVRLRSAADGLVNALGEAFAPFLIGAFESVTEAMKTAVGFLDEFQSKMGLTQQAGEGFATSILVGIGGLLDGLTMIMTRAEEVGKVLAILYTPFQVLFAAIGLLLGALTQAISSISGVLGFDETASSLQNFTDGLAQQIDVIADDIRNTFDTSIHAVRSDTLSFIDRLGDNMDRIRRAFTINKGLEEVTPKTPGRDEPVANMFRREAENLADIFPILAKELLDMSANAQDVTDNFARLRPDHDDRRFMDMSSRTANPFRNLILTNEALQRVNGDMSQIFENLLDNGISVKGIKQLTDNLMDVQTAFDQGRISFEEAARLRTSFIEDAGGLGDKLEPPEPPDFGELKSFIGQMSATESERMFVADLAGFTGVNLDAILDSTELTNSVVDEFINLFEQMTTAVDMGRLEPQEFADINQALQQKLLEAAESDIDPTQGFTDSLQTALGAVKVDPFAETSQKRTMKASEETAKATQEIAKNTKGLGSILT